MDNDSVFKALSDENRRKIIKILRKEGDMTAGNIAAQFSISQPAVSDHLKVLRNADLVVSQKKGQYIKYTLNETIFHELVEFFFDFVESIDKGGKNEKDK